MPKIKKPKITYEEMIDDKSSPWWYYLAGLDQIVEALTLNVCRGTARDEEGTVMNFKTKEPIGIGKSSVVVLL